MGGGTQIPQTQSGLPAQRLGEEVLDADNLSQPLTARETLGRLFRGLQGSGWSLGGRPRSHEHGPALQGPALRCRLPVPVPCRHRPSGLPTLFPTPGGSGSERKGSAGDSSLSGIPTALCPGTPEPRKPPGAGRSSAFIRGSRSSLGTDRPCWRRKSTEQPRGRPRRIS